MTEKKPRKSKTPVAKPAAAPAPEPAAKPVVETTPAVEAPKVIGPGVMKRPKRDPNAPPPASEEVKYAPSEQVFRRRT